MKIDKKVNEKMLEEANKELAVRKKHYYEQIRKCDHLKVTIELPNIISKYEGKYFRGKDSYGSSYESWFIYYYVKEVFSTDYCKVVSIGIDSDGKLEAYEEDIRISLLEEEISKSTFLKETEKHIEFFENILKICQ